MWSIGRNCQQNQHNHHCHWYPRFDKEARRRLGKFLKAIFFGKSPQSELSGLQRGTKTQTFHWCAPGISLFKNLAHPRDTKTSHFAVASFCTFCSVTAAITCFRNMNRPAKVARKTHPLTTVASLEVEICHQTFYRCVTRITERQRLKILSVGLKLILRGVVLISILLPPTAHKWAHNCGICFA